MTTEQEEIIFSSLIDIATDFVNVVKGEGGQTYYSSTLKKVVDIKQILEIIEEAKQLEKNEEVVDLGSWFVKNSKKDIEKLNKLRNENKQ